jgi:hypothetical protein
MLSHSYYDSWPILSHSWSLAHPLSLLLAGPPSLTLGRRAAIIMRGTQLRKLVRAAAL